MYLKKIIKNLSPGICSTNTCPTSKPREVNSCGRDTERARELLRAYDSQEGIPWKISKKCPEVVKDQLKREATFKTKELYVNALEEINKALCFAPTNSASLGILYASRAQVLGEMKLYAEAIESIKLALDNDYPEFKRESLEDLQFEYEDRLSSECKKDPEKKFRITLSYPACHRNPYVIADMHIEKDCQYGRHLIADRDLKVGDVICIEKPFVKCIQPEQRYMRCTHCLKEAPHLLIPCPSCTSAMFCSVECKYEAGEQYHGIECAFIDELMGMEEDVARLAMRIFLIAMQRFDGEITEMKEYLSSNKSRKMTPFDVDHRITCKGQLFLNKFLAYYNGNCADSHLDDCVKAAKVQEVARLVVLLSKKGVYADQLECDQLKVFLMEVLYHFLCVNTNNSFEVGSASMDHKKVPTCLGIYLNMSMASHSCAANVIRLRVGGGSMKLMWVVSRSIPKGGQIFDNYGAFFMAQPKRERQARLKQHYGFECTCEACELDYPMAPDLPEPEDLRWPEETDVQCGKLTIGKLKAELLFLRTYMTRNESHFPCKQLRKAEMRLVELFREATKDESMETRFPEYTTHKTFEQVVGFTDPWDVVAELGNII